MDGLRNQLLGDGPFEHMNDSTYALVNYAPLPSGVDHLDANRFELDRPEVRYRGQPVQFAKRFERKAVVVYLAGWASVRVAVMLLDMGPECRNQFVDSDACGGLGGIVWPGLYPMVCKPFGDELVIRGLRLGGAELSEIVILSVEANNCLAGCSMVGEFRDTGD